MSRFLFSKDITANMMKNTTNPFYPQLTMSEFSKLDSQTVLKCFYLWLINTLLSRFKERSLTILQKQKRELERSYLSNQDIEVI